MIFGGFEDGKWQPMEGGCLGLKSLPENGRKVAGKHHEAGGGGAGHVVQREEREKKQSLEEEAKPCDYLLQNP